jgi:hypothetical protein
MRITLKSTTIAVALATATLAGTNLASAAGLTFDIGRVAVGYSDGYYDNDHNWHRWAHSADARHYRAAHKDQYHTWRHDDPKHKDD